MGDVTDRVGLGAGLDATGVSWRELDDAGRRTNAVDGVEPLAICWPGTADEVAKCLQVADRLGIAVSPRGSGTKTGLGNRPRACELIVSTERLNQVIEYAPANLTVTAEAGITLATLKTALAASGQTLPIDPPDAVRSTLGGVLASNTSGPRRLGFGTGRDLVIGTRSVTASGTIVRSGGRVVKNVAGYDLGKLYIGSLGTLVLLVEVNLKLTPIPEAETTVVGHFSSIERIADVSLAIARSPLMPMALEIVNSAAADALDDRSLPPGQSGYYLIALGGAPGGGVNRQAAEFTRLYHDNGADEIGQLDRRDGDRLWQRVSAQGSSTVGEDWIRIKVAAPPGRLLEVWRVLEAHSDDFGGDPRIGGRAASGIFYVSWLPSSGSLNGRIADTASRIDAIRREIGALGGSLVVEACPTQLKEHLDVWGDVGTSLPVMKRLKSALDPRGIMNPGRFVGGI
jgi:glycolate oxidase FAD binding subunit